MFLAINELLHEKTRFMLIGFVIVLVGYLTFFLTALAYGLATSYTQGIDKWNATGIALQKNANNIARSLLTKDDYGALLGKDSALIGVGSATIGAAEAKDVSLFGIEKNSFLSPPLSQGQSIADKGEVVVDESLQLTGLVELGRNMKFKGSDKEYKVVGFVKNATFQTVPIVYMELDAWRDLASELAGMRGMRDSTTVSAIVTKNANGSAYETETVTWQSIKDFSFALPGYNAQVLTFGLMIGFLILIASLVLAVFMYVLTLQKKSIFGVLKAEGIASGYIARSVLLQTIILSVSGLLIGLGLAVVSGFFLGSAVPFLINPIFFAAITLLFLLFATIGSLVSVRSVVKIDPIEAIG